MTSNTPIFEAFQAFGYSPSRIYPPQAGYRNYSYQADLTNGPSANLIVYKSEPGILKKIRAANTVSNYLAMGTLPARSTLDPRILRLTSSPVRYAALYHYLPGSTIPWEAYTMEHLKLLGSTMAQIHRALKPLLPSNLPLVTTEYLQVLARMQAYFTDLGVITALRQKLNLTIEVKSLVRAKRLLIAAGDLPARPLHMDFVRGNILFSDSGPVTITGILDFEKTALGHPVFDISRTLAFLLVDCKFKSATQVRKYFLYSGYLKRGGGELPQPKLLAGLINFFLIYDLYKFLRHNPYEFLPQNEHFVRTRSLIESNLKPSSYLI